MRLGIEGGVIVIRDQIGSIGEVTIPELAAAIQRRRRGLKLQCSLVLYRSPELGVVTDSAHSPKGPTKQRIGLCHVHQRRRILLGLFLILVGVFEFQGLCRIPQQVYAQGLVVDHAVVLASAYVVEVTLLLIILRGA